MESRFNRYLGSSIDMVSHIHRAIHVELLITQCEVEWWIVEKIVNGTEPPRRIVGGIAPSVDDALVSIEASWDLENLCLRQ